MGIQPLYGVQESEFARDGSLAKAGGGEGQAAPASNHQHDRLHPSRRGRAIR